MRNRTLKTLFTLSIITLAGYLSADLPLFAEKAGLRLFSKEKRCSVTFCGASSRIPASPRPAHADIQGEAEEALICQCGCGIVLKHCPHENCGFAIPAREYIGKLAAEGKSRDEIIDIFVKEYGQKALAAPKKEGFNILGYILPFIALIGAAFFISRVLKSWTSRGERDEEKVMDHVREDEGSDLDRKIEEDLKKMD